MSNMRNKEYPESKGGIMICGINWGGKADGPDDGNSGKYAFSDKDHNSFRYSEALIDWLEAWGVPLGRSSNPGPLERCFIQTNWCDSQSRSAAKITEEEYRNTPLFAMIQHYKPRAIILTAVSLFQRFQRRATEEGLKEMEKPAPCKPIPVKGKNYRAHLAEYADMSVVAVPHPSRFRSIIGKSIGEWKTPVRGALGRVIDPSTGAYIPFAAR